MITHYSCILARTHLGYTRGESDWDVSKQTKNNCSEMATGNSLVWHWWHWLWYEVCGPGHMWLLLSHDMVLFLGHMLHSYHQNIWKWPRIHFKVLQIIDDSIDRWLLDWEGRSGSCCHESSMFGWTHPNNFISVDIRNYASESDNDRQDQVS